MLWFLFVIFPLAAQIQLDEVMTRQQMQQTGINRLNFSQRMALQEWINDNFEPKENALGNQKEQLFLSLNINDGQKLELSDGKTYEIAPEDRLYTMYWITPIPVMLGRSNDSQYPIRITNMNTGTSVNAKEISTQKMLEEETEKEKALPPPSQVPGKTGPQQNGRPAQPAPKQKQQQSKMQTQPRQNSTAPNQ